MIYVYDTDNIAWNDWLMKLSPDKRDIYFTREYYKMYENNGDGKGLCFVYTEGDKIAIYPFLINPITGYALDKEYYDIETAYGYGGPITSHNDDGFIKSFEQVFMKFCNEQHIIAEFVRFHPLIKNENIFFTNMSVIHNRNTVYLDLSNGIDNIWKEDISSKNRNMIRKSRKCDLFILRNNDYKTFQSIYEETMIRVNSSDYYYFNENYYTMMKKDTHYHLLNVIKDENVIAAAIFIQYKNYFHYHLAGSLREYLKYAPNNFLLWEAIKFAYDSGAKYFHLGGGRTADLRDPLFKYKRSFSSLYTSFHIGKRVHNRQIYDSLMNTWQKKYNRQPILFLQYKFKL